MFFKRGFISCNCTLFGILVVRKWTVLTGAVLAGKGGMPVKTKGRGNGCL